MDQVYPFNINKAGPLVVQPRNGCAGILELHPLFGEVFLFKGSLTAKECEEQIAFKPVPGWLICANSAVPSTIEWNGNQSEFTVFTWSEGSAGFVRISEILCSCK